MNKRTFLWAVLVALVLSKLTPDLKPTFPFWETKSPLSLLDVHAQSNGFESTHNIHAYFVPADATDANNAGTGLLDVGTGTGSAGNPFQFAIPANPQALKVWYDCQLLYSQGTAAVSDTIGLKFSAAPTASVSNLLAATAAAGTGLLLGTGTSITATTATNVGPAFTPGATSTTYSARLWGYAEMPASNLDTTVNVQVSQATQADQMTLKRDSVCMVHSLL
jgi:hypothetical protein